MFRGTGRLQRWTKAPGLVVLGKVMQYESFAAEEDYHAYRHWLGEALRECGCRLHAYVLMTNHVHLLLTPNGTGFSFGATAIAPCYRRGTRQGVGTVTLACANIQSDAYLHQNG